MLFADCWQLLSFPSMILSTLSPPPPWLSCSSLASSNQFSSVAEPLMCALLMHLRRHAGSSRQLACKPIVSKHPRWSLVIRFRSLSAHFQAVCMLFSRNVRPLHEKNEPTVPSCLVLLWFLKNRCHRVCLGVAINTDDRSGLLNCKHQTLETSSCFSDCHLWPCCWREEILDHRIASSWWIHSHTVYMTDSAADLLAYSHLFLCPRSSSEKSLPWRTAGTSAQSDCDQWK